MNNKLFFIFSLCSLLATAPAVAHETHGQAQHGGIVAEAGQVQFEIVAQDGALTVYVTSHGAPVATAGASGKLTVLVGASKSEIALQPAGDNLLRGQGALAPGAKLLVSLQRPGQKTLQARVVVQ